VARHFQEAVAVGIVLAGQNMIVDKKITIAEIL
jgi:hypothetical protein